MVGCPGAWETCTCGVTSPVAAPGRSSVRSPAATRTSAATASTTAGQRPAGRPKYRPTAAAPTSSARPAYSAQRPAEATRFGDGAAMAAAGSGTMATRLGTLIAAVVLSGSRPRRSSTRGGSFGGRRWRPAARELTGMDQRDHRQADPQSEGGSNQRPGQQLGEGDGQLGAVQACQVADAADVGHEHARRQQVDAGPPGMLAEQPPDGQNPQDPAGERQVAGSGL